MRLEETAIQEWNVPEASRGNSSARIGLVQGSKEEWPEECAVEIGALGQTPIHTPTQEIHVPVQPASILNEVEKKHAGELKQREPLPVTLWDGFRKVCRKSSEESAKSTDEPRAWLGSIQCFGQPCGCGYGLPGPGRGHPLQAVERKTARCGELQTKDRVWTERNRDGELPAGGIEGQDARMLTTPAQLSGDPARQRNGVVRVNSIPGEATLPTHHRGPTDGPTQPAAPKPRSRGNLLPGDLVAQPVDEPLEVRESLDAVEGLLETAGRTMCHGGTRYCGDGSRRVSDDDRVEQIRSGARPSAEITFS
ncbi:MAG: hypothetical protein E4H37_08610 [Gemmatimonadales bacterium]|nr:MAG: hypothetical protein E4H37_08610 [Gemmatimonadales bacterium]